MTLGLTLPAFSALVSSAVGRPHRPPIPQTRVGVSGVTAPGTRDALGSMGADAGVLRAIEDTEFQIRWRAHRKRGPFCTSGCADVRHSLVLMPGFTLSPQRLLTCPCPVLCKDSYCSNSQLHSDDGFMTLHVVENR